ncbi:MULTISPECIES: hypothetical protein [Arthrobacter]|uniref:Uncharacterized protein n=1 Tax=Arthrobacter terricola TaxID=2547396 RepID=A0A4R5KE19_9MICC|nr:MULTISPECIES: hypothetical protein [Arthrobacter]MBT8162684.1 hypothetical protein [Arthrobacter sp. GN70]TDF92457.1 hypothetical protein E1809_18145 [Arthrobacter terricola]
MSPNSNPDVLLHRCARPVNVPRHRILRTAVATILLAAALSGCANETLTPLDVSGVVPKTPADSISYAGGVYTGWWDKAPLPGQPTNLVLYSTKMNQVVQTVGSPTALSAKNMEFLQSPKWAKNVIIVMDPATNTIAGTFAIDAKGNPTNKSTLPVKTGGYEGWWNATPADGNTAGLPVETVQVNTDTNEVIDGYNRTTKSTNIAYAVVPDPAWPRHSVVVIDTSTNKVIASFKINADGT